MQRYTRDNMNSEIHGGQVDKMENRDGLMTMSSMMNNVKMSFFPPQ